MKFETIKEAAEEWVRGFNAIQQDMIARLMKDDIDEWQEVTKPSVGDYVYVYGESSYGEIVEIDENGTFEIDLDNSGTNVCLEKGEFEVQRDGFLPMWGWMWSFGENIDDDWLSGEFGEDGLQLMSNCGFRIYEHEEWGYFFGIDGAGYDFMESHWIPLYKARGLHWHKEEAA